MSNACCPIRRPPHSAPASWASGCPHAERIAATSTAEAVRLRLRVGSSRGPRWARAWPRTSMAPRCWPRASRTAPTTSPASCGSRAPARRREAHGPESKTSIVFWGFNDESPGALVSVLRELSDRQINLTRIESRPRRVRLGHYMFFADLSGPDEGLDGRGARSAAGTRGHAARAGLLRRRRAPLDRRRPGGAGGYTGATVAVTAAGTTGRGGFGARAGSSGRAAGTPPR